MHWQGSASTGGEECYLHLSDERADPRRLPGVLDRHNVTPGEWAALAEVCGRSCPFNDHFFKYHAESSARQHSATVTLAEFRDGLQTRLHYGWLRVLDRVVLDEVRELLRDDPVHLAVPRMANLLKV
jgi:hypothetical protein